MRFVRLTLICLLLITIGLAGAACRSATNAGDTRKERDDERGPEKKKPAAKPAGTKEAPVESAASGANQVAVIETDKGKIVFEFFPDVAPKTVDNFIKLAQKGFYNGLTFHRVVPAFVIQGGDPNGNGTGGPGYTIKAEFSERKHLRGTVAMARSQLPDSAGSQFYICLEPQPSLDGQYTVFGQVIEGIEVIDKIQVGDVMRAVRIEERQ